MPASSVWDDARLTAAPGSAQYPSDYAINRQHEQNDADRRDAGEHGRRSLLIPLAVFVALHAEGGPQDAADDL